MSLFRNLTEAAINANLNKNESKVFIVLLNQTLGYGKAFDNLTNKRLAKLTGIRQDRLPIAIAGVIDNDLFEVEPSRYYQFRYQIASKFLEETPKFFTPHLPKNRENPQEKENVPENRVDPPKFGILPNITLTSFNLTSLQPQQTAESENLLEKASLPEIKQSDVVVVDDDVVADADIAADVAADVANANANVAVIDLPKTISQAQQSSCLKALQGLTFDQKQRVIDAYKIKDKSEVIYNPVGLLVVLARAERNGSLILPKSANTIFHPSHKPFVSDKEETQKQEDNKSLPDHFGRLTWLKEAAQREGKPFLEFAKFMQMNAYVEDPKMLLIWLKYHAKKDNQALEVLAKSLSLDWVLR